MSKFVVGNEYYHKEDPDIFGKLYERHIKVTLIDGNKIYYIDLLDNKGYGFFMKRSVTYNNLELYKDNQQ